METVTVDLSKTNPDRLSAQDASFVYAETPDAPMHVGMLGVFEDRGVTVETLQRHVASRVELFPRLRQRLAFMAQGHPIWVDDEDFDIRQHIDREPLMDGADDARARQLMARVMSAPLRRARPLWEMWLFKMTDDRVGLIVKIHHCLLDGVSAMRLATVLFDARRDAPATEAPVQAPPRPPAAKPISPPALSTAEPLLKRAQKIATSVAQLAIATLNTKRRAPLTPRVGGHRLFETISLDLAEVKAVKAHYGTKLNDVVLATVASGIGALLRKRGTATDGATIKAIVPVSRRGVEGTPSYGNKVSMIAVDLPVQEQPLDALLCQVSRTMTHHKQSGQAEGADFWVRIAEHIPASLVSLVSRAATMQRLIDVVVTNVPGPAFPLYLLGGELSEVYPFVPLFGGTSLGIAVVSYNGRLHFGLSGDRDATPDLATLGRALAESFRRLHDELNDKGEAHVTINNRCGNPSRHDDRQTEAGQPGG